MIILILYDYIDFLWLHWFYWFVAHEVMPEAPSPIHEMHVPKLKPDENARPKNENGKKKDI